MKKSDTIRWKNMFGLWSYGTIDYIDRDSISAKLIHPDDADYDYDPNFRVPLQRHVATIELVRVA